MSRLTLKDRVTLASALVLAAGLAVLTLGFNLLLSHRLTQDAVAVLRERADAQLAALDVQGGRVVLRDAIRNESLGPRDVGLCRRPLDPAGARRPAAPAGGRRARRCRARHGHDAWGKTSGCGAEPASAGQRRVGTVVVALSLEPYERTERIARLATLLLDVFVLAAGVLLGPPRRRRGASARRRHDRAGGRVERARPRPALRPRPAARRAHRAVGDARRAARSAGFEPAPRAALLGRDRARAAHAAQRDRGEAELALRRERGGEEYRSALKAIATRARQLQRVLATLLATARAQAAGHGHRCDPSAVAERVLEAHRTADFDGEGPRLELIDRAGGAAIGAEEEVVERILAPLVENACAHARSLVRVTIERAGDELQIAVDDDGPGIPADEHERIFDPGYRASAASENGAGLGLALSRRLARAIGGEVQHPPDANGGGHFRVSLPAL